MEKIGYISLLLAVFGAGILFSPALLPERHMPESVTMTVADTLVVRDTVVFTKPVPKYVHTMDTILIPVLDTLLIHDTVFIALALEQKVYGDSTYRAVVSGYRPSLDTISVYPVTRYISTAQTIFVPSRKRWSVTAGPQAGYGMTPKGWQPYAGIGVTFGYTFGASGNRRATMKREQLE